MCNCNINNSCGCSSTVLPIGPDGIQGDQGIFGGYSAEWVFSTSTSTTPSSTQLRLNSATYAVVTEIYVSNTGTGSINQSAFLTSLSNNTNFGYIRIFKIDDSTKFWNGQITAVTNNGSDHTLVVTNISSNSTFSSSDAVVLTFSPTGPQGPDVLYSTTTSVSTANAAMTILQTYNLIAGQLATIGSYVEIVGLFSTNATTEIKGIDIRLGGTVANSKVPFFPMMPGIKYTKLVVRASRVSATTLFVEFETTCSNNLYYKTTGGTAFFETGVSVANMDSNSTAIELRGLNVSAGTETISADNMIVTYYKK